MRCLQLAFPRITSKMLFRSPAILRADRNWLDIKSTQNRKELPMSPLKARPYLMKSSAQAVASPPFKTGTLISETGIYKVIHSEHPPSS
jgi:hypothetical protein